MTLKNKPDQQTRIDDSNLEFKSWLSKNPGKKFSDFYVSKVSSQLDRGKPHATIGGRLKGKQDFNESGIPMLNNLIRRGMEPGHVCIDYGCGSLRVGQHIMNYLEPGHFWGLDIADRFFKEGVELLGSEFIDRCRPNLRVISRESAEEVAAAKPDFLLSLAVLIHVPPTEVDEFWDHLMTCITDNTRTLFKIKCSDELIQYSGRSWTYPETMIEQAIEARGGHCSFEPLREEHNDELDYQVRHHNLSISRT